MKEYNGHLEDRKIEFSTARLAKEVGFRNGGFCYFTQALVDIPDEDDRYCRIKGDIEEFEGLYYRNMRSRSGDLYEHYERPTQSILSTWLRSEHGVHIIIIPTITSAWMYKTVRVTSKVDDDVILGLKSVSELPPYNDVCGEDFNTYEDAMESCLRECLSQIKYLYITKKS